jgi:hypothetical protein
MSDAGDTGTTDTQNGETEAAEGQPDHLQALTSRMDEFGQKLDGIDQIREALAQQYQDDDGDLYDQDEAAFDPYAEEVDDALYDGVTPQEIKQAQEKLQSMIDQRAQQIVGPLQQQVENMRIRGEANDIARELPDLDDPDKAAQAIQHATQVAAQLGYEDLANEPRFIRLAHLARRAEVSMQQETPAGGQDGVRLEGAGTGPVDLQSAEQEYGDRIVGSGPGRFDSLFGGG